MIKRDFSKLSGMRKASIGLCTFIFCATMTPAVMAAQTLVSQTAQDNVGAVGDFAGQSFNLTTGSWNNIQFTFTNSGNSVGAGNLYLLTSEYVGTPAALSASTAGYIGKAAYNGSTFAFSSALTLTSGLEYYVYSDTSYQTGYSYSNTYNGGMVYGSSGSSNNYSSSSTVDRTFAISGTAASVPEPATWMVMVGGFGMVGAAMRRSRKAAISYS